MLVQFGLAEAGNSVAALGALHPVNGLAVLVISHFLARGPGGAAEHRRRRRKRGRAGA